MQEIDPQSPETTQKKYFSKEESITMAMVVVRAIREVLIENKARYPDRPIVGACIFGSFAAVLQNLDYRIHVESDIDLYWLTDDPEYSDRLQFHRHLIMIQQLLIRFRVQEWFAILILTLSILFLYLLKY